MGLAATILGFGVGAVLTLWIGSFVFFKAQFRHRAQVAVPMGESADDVVWIDDKFKTRKRNGHVEISFYKTKGKVYSPPYRWWSKWLKKSKSIPQTEPATPGDTGAGDGWYRINDPDLRKHLYRGAFFYKISDDELLTMKIIAPGKFKILDHDSRELIMDEIMKTKELTTSFRDKLVQLGLWLGSLIVISTLAIVLLVLTMKYAGEQSTAIIDTARAAVAAQAGVGG